MENAYGRRQGIGDERAARRAAGGKADGKKAGEQRAAVETEGGVEKSCGTSRRPPASRKTAGGIDSECVRCGLT